MILKLIFILLFGYPKDCDFEIMVPVDGNTCTLVEQFQFPKQGASLRHLYHMPMNGQPNSEEKNYVIEHEISKVEGFFWAEIIHDKAEQDRIKKLYQKSI